MKKLFKLKCGCSKARRRNFCELKGCRCLEHWHLGTELTAKLLNEDFN